MRLSCLDCCLVSIVVLSCPSGRLVRAREKERLEREGERERERRESESERERESRESEREIEREKREREKRERARERAREREERERERALLGTFHRPHTLDPTQAWGLGRACEFPLVSFERERERERESFLRDCSITFSLIGTLLTLLLKLVDLF